MPGATEFEFEYWIEFFEWTPDGRHLILSDIAPTRYSNRRSTISILAEIDSMELILRFTLSHPAAHTVIVGTQSLEHMAANMEPAAKGPLDPALVEEIRSRTAALD